MRFVRMLVFGWLAVAAAPRAARANAAAWFDPGEGCGPQAVFARTHRVHDLPGCTARLPVDAPAVERALSAMKRALALAETRLDAGSAAGVASLLDEVERGLALKPPPHPELPDRWVAAGPFYRSAMTTLRQRLSVVSHLVDLRRAYRTAVDAAPAITARERDGGPEEALLRAIDCIGAFEGLGDLPVAVSLEDGRVRPVGEWLADCRAIRDRAEPLAQAELMAIAARRAEWRRSLDGDRLVIFDAHPHALPELAGPGRGPRAAVAARQWRYTTAAGVEVFSFRGNRLAP